MKRILIMGICLLLTLAVDAQNSYVRKQTRKGNREYNRRHYDRAEVDYRRALQSDSTAYRTQHNLGNALYRSKEYPEAIRHYDMALREPTLDPKTRSGIHHNRGNCHLQAGLQKDDRAEGMEDFQQAVSDYQEALKLDPKNDDTRYNLSYAMKMLRQAQQQQQQQGNGQQNQQDQKDKQGQQDKQNQQNQQDQQQQNQQNDQGQQNQQNQQQQRDQRQKQQGQKQQKKQDAERLLEAVKNNEKSSLKEHAKRVETGSPRRIEKDW